jgi:hypothetical protein
VADVRGEADVKGLGAVLLEEGVLTEDQLMDAIGEQERSGQTLGRTLVDLGLISENQLVRALASQVGLEFVELSNYPVDVAAVALVPTAVCRRHSALPISFEDGVVKVAMSNPGNAVAVDDIRTMTNRRVVAVVATHDDVLAAIDRYCRPDIAMTATAGVAHAWSSGASPGVPADGEDDDPGERPDTEDISLSYRPGAPVVSPRGPNDAPTEHDPLGSTTSEHLESRGIITVLESDRELAPGIADVISRHLGITFWHVADPAEWVVGSSVLVEDDENPVIIRAIRPSTGSSGFQIQILRPGDGPSEETRKAVATQVAALRAALRDTQSDGPTAT